MNELERLRAMGLRCERQPLRPEDRLEAIQKRLRETGEYYPLGRHHHFRAYGGHRWTLPPSWLTFIEDGALSVYCEGQKRPLLNVLSPYSAVLWTQEMLEALSDHRYGKWPHDQPERYGLDRCIMFAAADGWMNGWAFDTRIRNDDGECCIRRIIDFSVDDQQMQDEWPNDDDLEGTVTPFRDWLHTWTPP